MRPRWSLALALPLAAAACTDFPTPAQLERATIIAVVAEPPIITPGDESRITVVVADQTGVLAVPARWELAEAFPGVAPMGALTADATGATYTAPDPLPPRPDNVPAVDAILVTVETPDGPLSALKSMPVLPAASANPTITALAVGGRDGMPGTVAVTKGETVELSVTIDPPAGEDARYAWYTPVGEIKFYQSNPCELVVGDEATTGPLLVVVRDGALGVTWRQVTLQVP